jgi:hypothetical protein
MIEHNGVLYKVTGEKLYSVNSGGVHTELGDIPGTGRAIMTGNTAGIVLVADSVPYYWDGSTLTTVTDNDLETPNSCAFLKSTVLYDGDGGRFVSADVGDPTSINGLNYATAESHADDIERVYVFDDVAYMMGDKTIEPWWFSGVGNPPLDPIENGTITVGLGALHSVANNDAYMYWLGDDNHPYRAAGTQAQRISDTWLHSTISNFSQISDAVGFCYNIENHNFYHLTFTGENRTFLFSESTGWTELSSGTKGDRHYGSSYAYFARKHLFADYRNSNIYEVDTDVYDDAGTPIVRTRETGVLHSGLFGKPGRRVEVNCFELYCETGQGALTGEGLDPQVMLSWSNDGGRTWSAEIFGEIGNRGEYIKKVSWNALGSEYDWVFRVRISDPVFFAIHSASVEANVGI